MGNGWIADIGGEKKVPPRIIGEPVRTDADGHPGDALFLIERENADGVLAAIGGEHEIPFLRDEGARHTGEAGDRMEVAVDGPVDHIDGVIDRVCDVDVSCGSVYRRMIEATRPHVRGQLNVAEMSQAHGR